MKSKWAWLSRGFIEVYLGLDKYFLRGNEQGRSKVDKLGTIFVHYMSSFSFYFSFFLFGLKEPTISVAVASIEQNSAQHVPSYERS